MDSPKAPPLDSKPVQKMADISTDEAQVISENQIKSNSFDQPPNIAPTPKISRTVSRSSSNEKSKANGFVSMVTNTNTTDTLNIDKDNPSSTPGQTDGQDTKPDLSKTSKARKLLLLSMFILAQFLDAFNNSALFPAIPIIAEQLAFDASETVWVVSAYQLTFAAFLLVSGRISDVYTPKPAFIAGCLIIGSTHLVGGFMKQKIALIVCRALAGIGGALTIPSALSLIVQLFPEPAHQARAISMFGSAGAIGNVLGLLIGAVLVQYAGWSWIFWFSAIIGIGVGIVCFFLIPNSIRDRDLKVKFDVPGVTILTIAMILFIFAVTSGSPKGWGTAYVLAPLLISILLFVLFFVWEARIPPEDASLPPHMWRYRNFGVLIGIAVFTFPWWLTLFVGITSWWQEVYGWTVINTAVHFLPIGIGSFLAAQVSGRLPTYFAHKHIILAGIAVTLVATILLPFGDSPDTYWSFVFPAFTIGTISVTIVFANSSIAVFHYTPPEVAGTVGAIFNCALQLGAAVGLAAVASIIASVDAKTPPMNPPVTEFSQHLDEITKSMWKTAFQGRAASFWFILATVVVQGISVLIFFKVDLPESPEEKEGEKRTELGITSEKG